MKNINDEQLLVNSYAGVNHGTKGEFNYDIRPLINENFDFYDLISNAKDSPNDNGAFLVITNNQYILGYNRGMGTGGHSLSFANAYLAINEGYIGFDKQFHKGEISSFVDMTSTNTKCMHDYLTARIYYEGHDTNVYGRIIYSGSIHFTFKKNINEKIPLEQFEMFEQFYNDYNDEIKSITRNNPNFVVSFSYYDDNSVHQDVRSKDFDLLYEYLKTHIDYDKKIEDEKRIIGVPKKSGRTR